MKIETWLSPNCSESSWRITGPKEDLETLKADFLKQCDAGDNVTKWMKDGTLLLQTTAQDAAGTLLGQYAKHPTLKFYEDSEKARDCTCGGDWCPEEKWEDISNVDKLVKGLVKPVKEKK
jgi:hypothetical protein